MCNVCLFRKILLIDNLYQMITIFEYHDICSVQGSIAKAFLAFVVLFTLTWSWAPLSYINLESLEIPNFYPAFQVYFIQFINNFKFQVILKVNHIIQKFIIIDNECLDGSILLFDSWSWINAIQKRNKRKRNEKGRCIYHKILYINQYVSINITND